MEREYNLETLEHLENVSTNKCRSWIALWRSPFVARMQCSGFLTSARSFIEREVAPVPLSSLVHCSVPPPPLPCALQCTFFQGTVCAEFYFTTKCTTLQQFTTMQWTFFPTNFNAIHGTVLQCTMCTLKCTFTYSEVLHRSQCTTSVHCSWKCGRESLKSWKKNELGPQSVVEVVTKNWDSLLF